MLRWIGRLCVIKKRVQDAWMDLMTPYTKQNPAFQQDFADLVRRNPRADEDQAFEEWYQRERERHARTFPINDNLFSLMVTVQADLSEQQREKLSAHMTMRGVRLQNCIFDQIRECMIELFFTSFIS